MVDGSLIYLCLVSDLKVLVLVLSTKRQVNRAKAGQPTRPADRGQTEETPKSPLFPSCGAFCHGPAAASSNPTNRSGSEVEQAGTLHLHWGQNRAMGTILCHRPGSTEKKLIVYNLVSLQLNKAAQCLFVRLLSLCSVQWPILLLYLS